jgi:hypothetical protein
MGYYKNEAIDDWTPAPKPAGIHVALQQTRRGRRYNEKKRGSGLTPWFTLTAMVISFVLGVVIGVIA